MPKKEKVTWHPDFGPSYTPLEMLELGVFEGKYINNIPEVPASWKKLPTVVGKKDPPDSSLNHYGVKSRQPLSVWKENGWIMTDANGWFHWYILYYLGRRLGDEDEKQINRWRSFVARHMGQIKASCKLNDRECHKVQRQGLLQWGWDSSTVFSDKQCDENRKRIAKGAGVSLEGMPSLNW